MKTITTESRVRFAIAILIFGGFTASGGIEATSEGTPIELAEQKLGPSAELVQAGGEASILVKGVDGQQTTLHLFDLEGPAIDSDGYAIAGEVRYQDIKGEGFLEMWNHVPAEKGGSDIGQSFFSRTMDVSGPLGKLTGESEWRPFQLPAFINDGSGRRPLKLTLNVVLPGEGTVEVRALKLQTIPVPKLISQSGISQVITIALSIGFGVIVVALFWFLRKRRSESELRRIQALDS